MYISRSSHGMSTWPNCTTLVVQCPLHELRKCCDSRKTTLADPLSVENISITNSHIWQQQWIAFAQFVHCHDISCQLSDCELEYEVYKCTIPTCVNHYSKSTGTSKTRAMSKINIRRNSRLPHHHVLWGIPLSVLLDRQAYKSSN